MTAARPSRSYRDNLIDVGETCVTVPGWKSRPQNRDLCGIAEAARLFDVQRSTVDKWRRRGVMPGPDYDLEGGPVWWSMTLIRWGRATGRL